MTRNKKGSKARCDMISGIAGGTFLDCTVAIQQHRKARPAVQYRREGVAASAESSAVALWGASWQELGSQKQKQTPCGGQAGWAVQSPPQPPFSLPHVAVHIGHYTTRLCFCNLSEIECNLQIQLAIWKKKMFQSVTCHCCITLKNCKVNILINILTLSFFFGVNRTIII